MNQFKKLVLLVAACLALSGCAAVSNPVADGIPVARVRNELLAPTKEDLEDIPFLLLCRHPITNYTVAAGDTLGIVIDGILGDSKQFIPVKPQEMENTPPSLGYPIPVQDDGTINVPQVPPIKVDGMTIPEIQKALRRAYTIDKHVVNENVFSAIVTLYRKRTYNVLVIRQDSGGQTSVSNNTIFGSTTVQSSPKRGTGQKLDLPFGENDVGNALARTGGTPGVDAINEVVIEPSRPEPVTPGEEKGPDGKPKPIKYVKQFIRIPFRVRPGDKFPFTEDDIILQNGDVIFIAARDADVFYTGGLLGGGQYVLPRDYDMSVLEAIAFVRGPLFNGAFSGNNLSGTVVNSGIGTPNPSRLSILRKTAGGGRVRIKVDLNLAARDPRQNPLVQSGDFLILQQSPGEAVVNYLTQAIKIDTVIHALRTPTVTSDVNTLFP